MKRHLRDWSIVLLVGVLAGLGILVPATAASAARAVTGPTITLDANGTGLDLTPTAEDLSKNTGIAVVVGSCEGGPYCVEFSLDQCVGAPAGCAWAADPDGEEGPAATSCYVSIEEYGWDYWLTVFVITHEAVHCLTWIGGAGFYHVEDRDSILNAEGSRQTMREQETRINTADRKMLAAIFESPDPERRVIGKIAH
jgi:hypothetical protein